MKRTKRRKTRCGQLETLIGDGIEHYSLPDQIQLPGSMRLENNKLEELIDSVYPGLSTGIPVPEFLAERATLAARNIDVNELNDTLLDRLPGEEHTYKSIDSVST
jgi:hypothetical protein